MKVEACANTIFFLPSHLVRAGPSAVETMRRPDDQQLPELKGGELRVSVDLMEMVQFLVESGQCKEVPATYVQPLEKRPSQTQAKVIPSHVRIRLSTWRIITANVEERMTSVSWKKPGALAKSEGSFRCVIINRSHVTL